MGRGLEARDSVVGLGDRTKVFVLGFLAGVWSCTFIFCEKSPLPPRAS